MAPAIEAQSLYFKMALTQFSLSGSLSLMCLGIDTERNAPTATPGLVLLQTSAHSLTY